MLRPDGYVKVLDFGIAKLAEQEVPVNMPRDEALLLVETNLGRYWELFVTCRRSRRAARTLINAPISGVSAWSFTKW